MINRIMAHETALAFIGIAVWIAIIAGTAILILRLNMTIWIALTLACLFSFAGGYFMGRF